MSRYQVDREKYEIPWFTDWFRSVLGKKRTTVDEIARVTGISPTSVMCYLLGVRSPTLRNFLLIVEALGMTVEIK